MKTTLIPNLGAEEGPDWRPHLDRPDVESAAWLWRLLFGAEVEVPDCQRLEDPTQQEGLHIDTPAFHWMDAEAPWAAWMLTEALASDAPDRPLACSPQTVWSVHDKAFAARVATLEKLDPGPWRGVASLLAPEVLSDPEAAIRRIDEAARGWPEWTRREGSEVLLKPRWGTSGRGRVRAHLDAAGRDILRAGCHRLATNGGALLEPWCPPVRESSVQFVVDSTGNLVMLGSLEPIVAAHGVIRGHRGDVDSRGRVTSARDNDETLRGDAAVVAGAARDEGFIGVCGVDGYTFRADDALHTRTAVEFNARFTLGTVAVGLVRRALPLLKRELGLEPLERQAFALLLDQPRGGWQEAAAGCPARSLLVPLWRRDAERRPALLFAPDAAALDAALALGASEPIRSA